MAFALIIEDKVGVNRFEATLIRDCENGQAIHGLGKMSLGI